MIVADDPVATFAKADRVISPVSVYVKIVPEAASGVIVAAPVFPPATTVSVIFFMAVTPTTVRVLVAVSKVRLADAPKALVLLN